MAGNEKKMVVEFDPTKEKATVVGGTAVPLENLVLMEKVDGALIKHKILSISENTVIRTNPNCHWVIINGVPYYICQ